MQDLETNESANRRWSRIGGPIADTAPQVMGDPLTVLAQILDTLKARLARGATTDGNQ